MIKITPEAASMIKQILESDEDLDGCGLRVGVRLGGCKGKHYALEFTPEPEEDDIVTEIHGIRVFASPRALPYLEGAELDFDTSPDGVGFKFNQPDPEEAPAGTETFVV